MTRSWLPLQIIISARYVEIDLDSMLGIALEAVSEAQEPDFARKQTISKGIGAFSSKLKLQRTVMTARKRARPEVLSAISFRVRLGDKGLLGPGKIELMELIQEHGSISAAGRTMGMAYRQAWMLVDELNGLFLEPVILKQTGGIHGGGAVLTPFGRDVVACYRRIEQTIAKAAAADIESLRAASNPNKAER
jgi:molybdate transport system regulatory protein